MANGDTLLSDRMVQGPEWWIQGHTFKTDARIIDLAAYDLILGMNWFEKFSPMTCDWSAKWLQFQHKGKQVKLQGFFSQSSSSELQEISSEQLLKWYKGNDIWATAIVLPIINQCLVQDQTEIVDIPVAVQILISEFQELF